MNSNEIIALLAQQEYKIALLYQEFSIAFPDYKNIWNSLVEEEMEHYNILVSFQKPIQNGEIIFNAMILKVDNLIKDIHSIDELINKMKKRIVAFDDALQKALVIEGSILEQGFCNFFSGDSKVLSEGLRNISTQTQNHYNILMKITNKKP